MMLFGLIMHYLAVGGMYYGAQQARLGKKVGFILFILGSIPFMAAVALTMIYAIQYMVFEKQGIRESMESGWALLIANIADSVIMYLIMAVAGFVIILGAILISLLIALPFVDIGAVAYLSTESIPLTVVVGILGGGILMIVWALIKGIMNSFIYHSWHLTFTELTGQKKAKSVK